jgi:hypothetical protein
MAHRPSRKKKRAFEEAEANITPVMNLMCVLIPMLLSTAKFVDLALLEYNPPIVQEIDEARGEDGNREVADKLLELRVNITLSGLEVSIFNAVVGQDFALISKMPDESYDFEAFREKLIDIKERIVGPPVSHTEEIGAETGRLEIINEYKYADAEQIRISAVGDIPLQTLIRVLDVSREYKTSEGRFLPLFPSPALGQFQ